MSQLLWKSLLVSPAILGVALLAGSPVKAAEELAPAEAATTATTKVEIAQAKPEATSDNSQLLNQIEQYSEEGGLNQSADQLTSVSQLTDVNPGEWAYEALRSLVERYGCIVGYPDRTFRGNRALTRWEFAAGLNACMNVMERLIQENVAILREDIEKLQRLMQEFEAELAALGARVDNLEGRVAFLEDHQFSTTTKLAGEVIIAGTGLSADDSDNQIIMGDRVRLELNTSFTGEDRLVTRLAAGNFGRFKNDYDTTVEGDGITADFDLNDVTSATNVQTFNLSPGTDNSVSIDWLAYYAPIRLGENLRLNTYIAGFGGIHSDYVPTINPYFQDFDGGNGALSTFASESPIYRIGGGAGFATSLELSFLKFLGSNALTVGYLAGGAGDPRPGQGLFNGDYAVLGQLNFSPFDSLTLGFTYVHGFHKKNSPIFGMGATDIDADGSSVNDTLGGVTGTALANLSSNNLNAAIDETTVSFDGGPDFDLGDIDFDFKSKVTNSYGGELAWKITDWLSFSGFFNYTSVILTGRTSSEIWTYGGGFAFPDLGKEGSVLGLFAGVQPYLGDAKLPVSFSDPVTGDERYGDAEFSNQNPIHIEAFYKYQLTDNISITPGVIYLISPEQTNDSADQLIGTLRTTFTF